MCTSSSCSWHPCLFRELLSIFLFNIIFLGLLKLAFFSFLSCQFNLILFLCLDGLRLKLYFKWSFYYCNGNSSNTFSFLIVLSRWMRANTFLSSSEVSSFTGIFASAFESFSFLERSFTFSLDLKGRLSSRAFGMSKGLNFLSVL